MKEKRQGLTLVSKDMTFVSTPAEENASAQKMDAALYPVRHLPKVGDAADWSRIELSFIFMRDPVRDDPFEDTFTDSHSPDHHRRTANLDHIFSSAKLVFDCQHRTHLFTIIIFGEMARIARWDRAGVLITEKFNYKARPHVLGRFLFCFSRLDPVARGHDPTAIRIEPGTKEYKLMNSRAVRPLLRNGRAVQEDARTAFARDVARGRPRWKLTVNTEDRARCFLVGRPNFASPKLIGRGTRGYIAIDVEDEDGPFVYLKDTWRIDYGGVKQEGAILEKLNAADVPSIPHLVCHGDVPQQATISKHIWFKQKSGEEGDGQHIVEDDPDPKDEDKNSNTDETSNMAVDEKALSSGHSTVSAAQPTMSEDGSLSEPHTAEWNSDTESAVSSEYDATDGGPDQLPDADEEERCPLKSHKHYRMVVKEVAKPLSTFKNGRELVMILIHVLYGTPLPSCLSDAL